MLKRFGVEDGALGLENVLKGDGVGGAQCAELYFTWDDFNVGHIKPGIHSFTTKTNFSTPKFRNPNAPTGLCFASS